MTIHQSSVQQVRRILAIDGGGIKGVFPTSFLATIEDSIEDSIAHYFDLIVGTSTGGIIALGLGLGLFAKEILAFYEESGPLIFSGNRRLRWLRWHRTAKYDSTPLREALKGCFGENTLGDSTKRLVIPSLNLENGEVYIYKTAHHRRLERDYKKKAVDVALATAAAPTYFPAHQSATGTPLIDGGMWANNPVALAVVEAIAVLEWPRDSLKILSLGCTTEPLNVDQARRRSRGKLYWAFKAVEVFMHAQSHGSLGTAKLLAGHENVIRINPVTPQGRFGLDRTDETDSLKGLGNSEARKALPQIQKVFFDNPAEPFDAFHN